MKSPVLKSILAAVLGYVVMFAVAFVLFSMQWIVLGADGLFEPGVWDVSATSIGTSIVFGLIVAMAGGFTCSKLGETHQAVAILLFLVIVVLLLTLGTWIGRRRQRFRRLGSAVGR